MGRFVRYERRRHMEECVLHGRRPVTSNKLRLKIGPEFTPPALFLIFQGSNVPISRSRPSVETEIVPRSPEVITVAPLAFHLSTTSGCGWPKGDERPTEITAYFAPTALI